VVYHGARRNVNGRKKVSYIVAARQTSQIMAILLGTVVLRELCGRIRLAAGSFILLGVTLIGIAR